MAPTLHSGTAGTGARGQVRGLLGAVLPARALDRLLAWSEMGRGKGSQPVIPVNTCPAIRCLHAREPEKEPTPSSTESQLLSTTPLPTFPQAEATFPAQTQRHGQASELPFFTQRNARQAAGPGCSPDSTCRVEDVGFLSTSQMQGDAGCGGGRDKIPGTAGETGASESEVDGAHPLQAVYPTRGDRESLWSSGIPGPS